LVLWNERAFFLEHTAAIVKFRNGDQASSMAGTFILTIGCDWCERPEILSRRSWEYRYDLHFKCAIILYPMAWSHCLTTYQARATILLNHLHGQPDPSKLDNRLGNSTFVLSFPPSFYSVPSPSSFFESALLLSSFLCVLCVPCLSPCFSFLCFLQRRPDRDEGSSSMSR
jgi:hypothetical protein